MCSWQCFLELEQELMAGFHYSIVIIIIQLSLLIQEECNGTKNSVSIHVIPHQSLTYTCIADTVHSSKFLFMVII